MKIIRAGHSGMCFGVRDAIDLAMATARREPLTILGDLVHNETVLAELQRNGIRIAQSPSEVATQTIMITAHGASEKRIAETRRLGMNVLEATCPLVRYAHQSLQKLARAGYYPVIIGKLGHVEVRGLTEDLETFSVLSSPEEVASLPRQSRYGVIAQTTQPIGHVRALVQLIRDRFPACEVRFTDTVCQPTKQRQIAAVELARQCDVVVVIGGRDSNNTQELVKTCSRYCARVHHARTTDDMHADWFKDAETVGITAGTSTPDNLIAQVEEWLRNLRQG